MCADTFKYAQLQPFSLAGAGAVIGDTSITLQSMTDIDGNALSMSGTFGSIGFGTLEPGNGTLEEQISFTGLSNNTNGTVTLSGVSNVGFDYPYTVTSGLLKTHAGATTFIISNTSGFYDRLSAKADDETITGTWTFTNPNYPRMDTSTPYPVDNEQLATKAYADSLTFAGAPDATTTQKGIVELATQAEVDAKTATGGTGASLVATPALARSTLLSDYVIDTGAADAYVITPSPAISAYATGQIFTFKSIHTNTTASTLNVNGKGATAIKKLNGATALVAGDIVSGQIIQVEYDGTNFQMINPVGNAPATQAYVAALATNIQTFLASGTWTKPANAIKVLVQAWGGGGSGSKSSGTNGSGGGGGGLYIERWMNAADITSPVTVTIGAGGVALSGSGVGNAGANTTFGTYLTAYGGAGGGISGSDGVGGAGGIVFTNISGLYGSGGAAGSNPGQDGIYSSGGGGSANGSSAGNGGASYFGGAGGGGSGSSVNSGGTSTYGGNGGAGVHNGAAVAGAQPGGGGGGNSGTGTSGAGGDGEMIVTTYF